MHGSVCILFPHALTVRFVTYNRGEIMFTGIVDHCAKIESVTHHDNGIQLSIQTQFHDFQLGESICVDGVCLTVTQFNAGIFSFDLSPETCALTIASQYAIGDVVNVERSMKMSDRLGGHIVTGHVDCTIAVKKIEQHNEFVLCEFFKIDPLHKLYLATKGSVCVNGVSLTINRVHDDGFSVMLIPHTLSLTNLSFLNPNDSVNVEYDYLAKLVANNITHYRSLYASL